MAGLLLLVVLGRPLPRPATVLAGLYVAAGLYVIRQVRAATAASAAVESTRTTVAFLLVLLVPVVFDPRTHDVFGVAKFTVLTVGAVALVAGVVAGWIRGGPFVRAPDRVMGAAVAVALWAAVATMFSDEPMSSLVGARGTYGGLATTASLVTVFLVLADTCTAADARRLIRILAIGAAGLVIAYGMVQLHDRLVPGAASWDWVRWGEADFRDHAVWSTMGNPNHLGAFLAIVAPLLAGLAVVERRRSVRTVVAAVALAGVVVLAYTSSRGAWLAAAMGLATAGLLGRRHLGSGRSRRVLLVGALVAAAVAAGALVYTGGRGTGGKPLFSVGAGSSAGVRLDLWSVAVQMTAERPLVGFGPDNFAAPFAARAPADTDPGRRANGAHNIFLQQAATIGLPGLGAFLSVIALTGTRIGRARRRLAPRDDAAVLLDAAAGAIVAALVALFFDVDDIALTFTLWVLLGVAVALARAFDPDDPASSATTPEHAWSASAILAVAAVVALAVVVVWRVTALHRADIAFLTALNHETVTFAPVVDGDVRARSLDEAVGAFREAARTAPLEPAYPATEAFFYRRLAAVAADNAPADASVYLRIALARATDAVSLRPSDPQLLMGRAEVLAELSALAPCAPRVRSELRSVLEAVARADPRLTHTAIELAVVAGDASAAREIAASARVAYVDAERVAALVAGAGEPPDC